MLSAIYQTYLTPPRAREDLAHICEVAIGDRAVEHLVNKAHTAISTHVDKMNPVVVRNAHHFPRRRVRPQEVSTVLLRPVVLGALPSA